MVHTILRVEKQSGGKGLVSRAVKLKIVKTSNASCENAPPYVSIHMNRNKSGWVACLSFPTLATPVPPLHCAAARPTATQGRVSRVQPVPEQDGPSFLVAHMLNLCTEARYG